MPARIRQRARDASLLAEDRQRLIVRRVGETGSVVIRNLARELGVSRETIRRDIDQLAARGRFRKTRGGAVAFEPVEAPDTERGMVNAMAKRAIGRKAASLVRDGASLILDSGTTTRAVAQALAGRRNLTIYTNDLAICRTLARHNGNKVVLLGGELQRHEEATIGWDAISALANYTAEFAFVGVGGLTAEGGITDFTRDGAELRGRMLSSARTAIIVADASKFTTVTPIRVPHYDKVTHLVTDRAPSAALRKALRSKGIRILTA
jgi:DeoR family transcriptional regulator, glycerol-3-phosphate regulon repressor